jgi:hypothetical protein
MDFRLKLLSCGYSNLELREVNIYAGSVTFHANDFWDHINVEKKVKLWVFKKNSFDFNNFL